MQKENSNKIVLKWRQHRKKKRMSNRSLEGKGKWFVPSVFPCVLGQSMSRPRVGLISRSLSALLHNSLPQGLCVYWALHSFLQDECSHPLAPSADISSLAGTCQTARWSPPLPLACSSLRDKGNLYPCLLTPRRKAGSAFFLGSHGLSLSFLPHITTPRKSILLVFPERLVAHVFMWRGIYRASCALRGEMCDGVCNYLYTTGCQRETLQCSTCQILQPL